MQFRQIEMVWFLNSLTLLAMSLLSSLSIVQIESDPKNRLGLAKTKTSKKSFFRITITLPSFYMESNFIIRKLS